MAILNEKLFSSAKFIKEFNRILREGDPTTLTASAIRKELEDKFDLDRDSMKEKPWKGMLNTMIDEYSGNEAEEEQEDEDEENGTKSDVESNEEEEDNNNNDTSSPEQVKDEMNSDMDMDIDNKEESPAPTKQKQDSSDNDNDDGSDDDNKVKSDSDQSDAATPPPQKKRRQKKAQSTNQKQTGKKVSNSKTTADDESIKRLKSYISKCGVRKLWQKELADCTTKKSQIAKLKRILEEIGVHGRPTIEKCETVKAERELKAEIDSLDTDNILEMADDGPSLRSSGLSKRKRRHVIQEDSDESGDEQTAEPLDVSFLGDQSDDDSD